MMEWLHQAQYSLVIYTLFTQTAVGAFWVLLVSDFLGRRAPDAVQDAFVRIGTYMLVPLTAVGLVFSTTHLGRPLYAWRALRHISTSWLSREIWTSALFFGLVALYTFLWWRRVKDSEGRRHVGVLTGLMGMLAVVSQAMIYQVPGRPAWNHPSIFLLFGGAVLLLGPLAVAAVYSFAWGRFVSLADGEGTVRQSHRRLGMTLLSGAVVYGVGLFWRMRFLAAGTAAAAADPAVAGRSALGARTVYSALYIADGVVRASSSLLWMEVGLGVFVPAVLALLLWYLHQRGFGLKLCNVLIGVGLGLVAVGLLAGRALFYLTGRPWF